MSATRPTDPLFDAIDAIRGTPIVPGEPQAQALLQQARDGGLRWHEAYMQSVLSIRMYGVDRDHALRLAETSLATFEALDSDWGRSVALSALGGALLPFGQVAKGVDLHHRAIMVARGTGDALQLCNCLVNAGAALNSLGQFDSCVSLLDEALTLADRVEPGLLDGVKSNMADALAEIARRERQAGAPQAQWEVPALRAVALLEPLLGSGLPGDTGPEPRPYTWGCMAAALVVLDRHDRARAIFQRLLPMYAQSQDEPALQYVHLHSGWSHLQCGEAEAALVQARAYLALVERGQRLSDEPAGRELEALALEQAGRWKEALASYKRFHAVHARYVLDQAEAKARALAVTMQTERALVEAQRDPLTDLANRRAFDAALAQAVGAEPAQPAALVLIDVDHFKVINDRHGHAAGDAVLRALADVLRLHCRAGDLPARLGGDELAVIVDGDVQAGVRLADRVRAALRQKIVPGAEPAMPTLSIGVAPRGQPATAAGWMAAADAALYAAKAAGRDAVRTHPSAA